MSHIVIKHGSLMVRFPFGGCFSTGALSSKSIEFLKISQKSHRDYKIRYVKMKFGLRIFLSNLTKFSLWT